MTDASGPVAGQRDDNQLVTFHLGQEEFGFDIMSVQEIIRQPQLSRVPMAPTYVEGIANLRGTVLPIIDTRTRFGMDRADDSDSTRILVVDVDGVKTGLRVDQVRQVTRIDRTDASEPPAVVRQGLSAAFLRSVVKLEGGKRIIMSLNPAAICRVEGDETSAKPVDGAAAASLSPHDGDRTDDDHALIQVVSFKLGREEFAFPMEWVREILRVTRPNEVPDTPKYVLGILTVRGNILPVIDLRVLLGMRTLAVDVVAVAVRLREGYERWTRALCAHAQEGKPFPDLVEPHSIKNWIAEFTTSSQILMETLSAMRVANDKVLRAAPGLRERDSSKRAEYFRVEMEGHADEVLSHLRAFEEQVGDNIQDDQRLVVVQTRDTLLALLVDKVREVLNVPKRLIGAAPRVGNVKTGSELESVARLDDGKRLIMLLSADRLLGDSGREAVVRATSEKGDASKGGGDQAVNEQRSEHTKALDEQQFVTFRLADGEYGIPINEIQEIDRSSRMTPIPNCAEYVDGITNLRGEVVPVINARKRFNLAGKESDEQTRVIIIDIGGKKTGLLVDSVRQVLNVATKDIAAPPASIAGGVDQRYIAGIGKVEDGKRMIVLLNVSRVVASDG